MEKTIGTRIVTTVSFIILALLLGAVVGGATWCLLKIMAICIDLVWQTGWSYFDFTLYPLVVCIIGGLVIGAWQKKFGEYPEELNEVMAQVKATGGYPYNKILIISVAALLPLIFGGSIGPEAGLTGVIAGFCTWVGDRFKYAAKGVQDIAQIGMAAVLSVIFTSPLFGFIAPFEEENRDITLPKRAKMILYFAAIFGGLGIFSVLGRAFGAPLSMGRFTSAQIGSEELLWFIPIAIVGVLAGYLYHFSGKFVQRAFNPLKPYPIAKAVIGGVILGGTGIFLPYTMFAGESQMAIVMAEWQNMAVAVLFLTGFIKLIIGNICWHSGWRGGNIFPVIFSGVCLGYALATVTGVDSIFAVIVATATLAAMVMRKPLMTAMVLLLCFPLSNLILLLLASFIGSAFPLPKSWNQPQEDNELDKKVKTA